MNAAGARWLNDWRVGDILVGTESGEGWQQIGDCGILGRALLDGYEGTWTLDARPWELYARYGQPAEAGGGDG